MIRIPQLNELQELLLEVPELIDGVRNRSGSSIQQIDSWLSRMTQALANNRITTSGNVAVIRGRLMEAERGVLPQGISFKGRPTRRKIAEAAAVSALEESTVIVSEMMRPHQERIEEARRYLMIAVAQAYLRGILREYENMELDIRKASAVMVAVSNDNDLAPLYSQTVGLVGQSDTALLMMQTLTSIESG